MKGMIQVMTDIDTIFTNTANSIRQKKNKTDKIKPENFSSEINSIDISVSQINDWLKFIQENEIELSYHTFLEVFIIKDIEI